MQNRKKPGSDRTLSKNAQAAGTPDGLTPPPLPGSANRTLPAAAKAWILILFLIAAGCAAFYFYYFDPLTSGMYPPCLFHHLTSLHCPGCGSIRAIHALAHGEILRAFGSNPMLFLAGGTLSILYIARRDLLCDHRLGWVSLFILCAFSVLRNIPLWPFSILAP